MKFRARARFSAARLVLASIALLSGLGIASNVSAAPADVTTVPIRAPFPTFSAPITVNLRAQGVIAGTPSLVVQQAQFFRNGIAANNLLEPRILQLSPGSVCLSLVNRDLSFNVEDRYEMALTISNAEGRDTGRVLVSFTGGPTTSPTDPACADPNRAPTAVIVGGDRTIADTNGAAGELVAFSSAGSADPEGDQLTYSWFVNGGDAVSSAPNPTLPLPDGTSRVTLIVQDEAGVSSPGVSVSITVNPPTTPFVDAGQDRTIPDSNGVPGETVTLTGTAGPPGAIETYQWRLGSTVLGSGASISAPLPDGSNVVTLAATLVTGLVITDTVTITVTAPPARPPTASAGPDQTVPDSDGVAGELVTLSGSGVDPDGTIVSYQWFLADAAGGGTLLGTGATLTTRIPNGTSLVRLVVTDNAQLTGSDTAVITVGAPQAPTASAGPDQTVPDRDGIAGELVTLTGTATDPDGTITSYRWQLGATLLGTGATLQARIPNGVNVVTLIATDNAGLTATDTVQITVGAPQAPTANAGPDQSVADSDGIAGELVTLAGSATDPDGTIASYQWSIGEGVLGAGATLQTRLPNGVNVVTLTVVDNTGLTDTDTVQITVAAPPQAPTANAGPDQTVADTDGVAGELVTLSGSGTDPDGTITSYQWLLGTTSLGTGATLQARIPNGVNTVTLRVTDNSGLTASDTVQITVAAPPQPPTANAGPDQTIADSDGEPGELVTLTGSGTDPDGTIASYTWLNGETTLGTGATLQVRLGNGAHTITLRVTDSSGLSATDTVQITVSPPDTPEPQPPTANAGADRTVADSDGIAGELVTLSGTATDPDGTIASYAWSLGDTSLGTGATLQVRLPNGVNAVTLLVTDSSGLTDTDSVQITVSAPQAPTANAGIDQTIADTDSAPGEVVTLTGTATDPDGTIATYAWTLGGTSLGTGATLSTRLANGVHVVTLTVTDNAGLTDTDTVQITVQAAPLAPTVDAGADQTVADTDNAAGELVTLTGTATDPDGTIASYQWLLGETTLGTGATLRVRIPDGVNTVTLRVTDSSGLVASDTVQITVTASALAPIPNAGADQTIADSDGAEGELVTLTGTATDSDGTIASYAWLLGETSLGTGATLQARIPDGVNAVTLRVTDSSGLTATDTVQITVTAPARPPTANAGADQNVADADAQPGELVTLTGTGSDPDGTIATYQWSNGTTVLGSSATLQTRLPDGVSTLTLLVTDNSGLTASDTVQVTVVAPVLPIVNVGIARTVDDTDVQAGELVELTGSATTSAGTITRYEWFLGNDSLGIGASISVRLPDGVNLVTLRATSSANAVGSATVQITVATPVRTVLSNIPGLTPNELRLAQKLDEACNNVLGPISGGGETSTPTTPGAAKPRPPTQAESDDFAQKCRGLLLSRDLGALRDAMGQLLGDDFAVARTQTLLFSNTLYASVMDRLIALRGGAKGLSLAGLNIIVDGELIPLAELQDMAKQLLGGGASSDADLWGEKWGVWARGNYSFGKKREDSLSPSFEADQYALLAGMDYRLSQSAVVGAALAYGNSTVEFNPSGEGSLDTESWALSMYGSLYAKKNFYFDAILNVADSGYQAERNITYVDGYGLVSADADGDTGGLTLSGGVSAGYDFLIGGLTISPTLGVFYIDAQIDEFTESGAGGLNLIYDEQKFKSLTGTLGMRMTFAMNFSWGVLLPHFRADYVREFEDDVDVFGIRFAADPNAQSTPPILVETQNTDTSYYRLAAGFSAQFKHGISGYVEYQRLESFQFISFQDVSVGLRFQAAF